VKRINTVLMMILEKQNAHKFTVKAARGPNSSRHERNRIRGTVIIMSTSEKEGPNP
jgi:hypothetical protein